MRLWRYRAHILSVKGTLVTQSVQTLPDEGYAIPEARAFAEEIAKERLRSLEGVTPDTPIISDGWELLTTDKAQDA